MKKKITEIFLSSTVKLQGLQQGEKLNKCDFSLFGSCATRRDWSLLL